MHHQCWLAGADRLVPPRLKLQLGCCCLTALCATWVWLFLNMGLEYVHTVCIGTVGLQWYRCCLLSSVTPVRVAHEAV